MEQVTGKEGKGVTGAGFTGATKSNSYVALPKSSNAELGIDAEVASGEGNAVAAPDSQEQNAGPVGHTRESMSNAKFGIDDDVAAGSVPSRRKDDVVNAAGPSPRFGRSALSGNPPSTLNQDSVLGSGARKEGTAAAFGEPGRGGSMAYAVRGLSGNTTGPAASKSSQPAAGAQKDTVKAEDGVKGSGGKQ